MVESTALLKRRAGKTVPGVRIPPSPFEFVLLSLTLRIQAFSISIRIWHSRLCHNCAKCF